MCLSPRRGSRTQGRYHFLSGRLHSTMAYDVAAAFWYDHKYFCRQLETNASAIMPLPT
jgi:hypothetical protein